MGKNISKSENPERPSAHPLVGPPQEYGEECGGKGGVPYLVVWQPPARLTRIRVWHRDYVDGIQLETNEGVLPRIGGTGVHRDVQLDTFEFGANEVLTGISVEFLEYLDQITFHTNMRNLGPSGGRGGSFKRTVMGPPGRSIVGFRGRHWKLVDSIQLMVV